MGCFSCFRGPRGAVIATEGQHLIHAESSSKAAALNGQMAASNPLYHTRSLGAHDTASTSACSSIQGTGVPMNNISTVAILVSQATAPHLHESPPGTPLWATQLSPVSSALSHQRSAPAARTANKLTTAAPTAPTATTGPGIPVTHSTTTVTLAAATTVPHNHTNQGVDEHDDLDFVSCAESFSSMASAQSQFECSTTVIETEILPAKPDKPAIVKVEKRTAVLGAVHMGGLTVLPPVWPGHKARAVKSTSGSSTVDGTGPTWAEGGIHVEALRTVCHVYKQQRHPCGACKIILDHCQQHPLPPGHLEQLAGSAPDEVQGTSRESLLRLVRAACHMQVAQRKVMDDSGWQVARDDVLKLMYHHVPDTTAHCFKGRFTLDAPIEHMVALAREFDLCKTWNAYCKESVVLEEYSPAELLGCAVQWMPWPLHNVNIIVEAVGTDLLDSMGGFMITFHTPRDYKDPKLLASVPGNAKANAYMRMLPGSCLFLEPLPPLRPGGPARTRATMEARCDPGIKHVPHILVTFVLKVLGPFVHSIVVKLLKKEFEDPTKPLPARIPTRPLLYNLVKEHSAEFLAKQTSNDSQKPT